MPQKVIKLQEAQEFVRNNGYLLAMYKKIDDNYVLYDDIYTHGLNEDTEIVVKTTGAATSFNEFTTVDKEYCFRLHTNLNIPTFFMQQ